MAAKSEEEAAEKLDKLQNLKTLTISSPSKENRMKLNSAALQFPNFSHPSIVDYKEPKVLYDSTSSGSYGQPKPFEEISRIYGGARTINTGETTTEKSYYLMGSFAELEQALIKYTVDLLVKRYGFALVSVPDILDTDVIEACGVETSGKITSVFKLDPRFYGGSRALSGTAEMGFGAMLMDRKLDFTTEHVKKFAAVSRCYRAESSMGKREKGLYRVHHFTKVEMFAVTTGDANVSNLVHEQMLSIQQTLFDDLGITYRVLDMHPGDLGNPASRKFDCEAIMPGHTVDENGEPFYGEISSTSNCLDYQSRRLNIRDAQTGQFCHTVNGTACAIPRMIMAICEQRQLPWGLIDLPPKLRPLMASQRNNASSPWRPKPREERLNFVYKKSPLAFFPKQ